MEDEAATTDIPLSDILTSLRSELEQAMEQGKGNKLGFQLDEVEVELQIKVSKSDSGKADVKFYVLNLGGETKAENVQLHRIRLKMTPQNWAYPGAGVTLNAPS